MWAAHVNQELNGPYHCAAADAGAGEMTEMASARATVVAPTRCLSFKVLSFHC